MLDSSIYRIAPESDLDWADHDPDAKTGFEGGKREAKAQLPELTIRLTELQRRLWAESKQGLLIILQATDTAGKDGTIRHVFRGVNPQGVHVRGFGQPSVWDLRHDYLWRVHAHTPEAGAITVFNRSHYEDVLVVRVHELVAKENWSKRYHHIREFERLLADEGTRIVKIFLNISKEEQAVRLRARLEEPDKSWKFHKSDLADRKLWDDFRTAYKEAIEQTSTDFAPWYVVPANRKWYRNLVVSNILIDTLEEMNPKYPPPEPGLDDVSIT
jgi:PPK2 family polyphosphate:nucleotide phosphotransferase